MPDTFSIPSTLIPPPHARTWRLVAWVAGLFSVLVAALMFTGHFAARTLDPLQSPQLKQAKEQLRLNPKDEAVKQQIRQLDLALRQRYFHQLAQKGSGTWLLLAGAALFVVGVTRSRPSRSQLPALDAKPATADQVAREAAAGRRSVAVAGAVVGALALVATLTLSTAAPKGEAEMAKNLGPAAGTSPAASGAPAADAASPEELRRNWPRFRGPDGGGIAASTNGPARWDVNSGAGIAWKVPVPAPGFNSPIAWEDRVFFSGGDAAKREVFCLDAKTGQIVWRQAVENVPGSPTEPPEIPESTGYTAPTMATDGRRVYVVFANGDVGAFTIEGKLAWTKGFGALKNAYGHATSLATWRDRLLLQLDQGESEEGKSKVYALDGRTGQVLWQRPRKVGGSWSSPIVFEAGGKSQVLLLAVPFAIAYSATDGAELWRAECLNGEITPSPVYAGGLVLIPSPSEKLLAIRPDGQGDVTKTHVAWFVEDNVPDVTSPVSNGELVFGLTTSGVLTCWDAKDGKKQWEHDFEMEFHSSPTLAGTRLYCFSQKGTALVVEAARQFKELFRADMGDGFHASPAFVGDRLVLRGLKQFYCVAGEK